MQKSMPVVYKRQIFKRSIYREAIYRVDQECDRSDFFFSKEICKYVINNGKQRGASLTMPDDHFPSTFFICSLIQVQVD